MMQQKVYNREFYTLLKSKINSVSNMAKYIVDIVEPKSIVDLGCGSGEWLYNFKKHGVTEIVGYDGAYVDKDLLSIPPESFFEWDLTQKLEVERKYDMAMSLEVAEHIEEKYADIMVENLTNLSEVVLFSAAIPGQGGVMHVNEKWMSYWREKFKNYGYVFCDCLRDYAWDLSELDYYYKQNMAIYVKDTNTIMIEKLSSIKKESMIDVVHPIAYLKYKANLEIAYAMLENLNGEFLKSFFKENQIKRIAIYGVGKIGRCLYNMCQNCDVEIVYDIDMDSSNQLGNIETIHPKDVKDGDTDMIIIASGYHYEEMTRNLEHLQQTKIMSIKDLFIA